MSIVLRTVTIVSGFVTLSENFMLLSVTKLPESWSVFNLGGEGAREMCRWDGVCIAPALALAEVSTVLEPQDRCLHRPSYMSV
jgi:hypothetical protein